MKPGWKTTEFWATVFVAIGAITGFIPGWGVSVSAAAYAIGRGLAKSKEIINTEGTK